MSLSLYGIVEELKALDQLLDIDGGEITEEFEQLEEEIKKAIVLKTDGCLGYLRKEEDQVKAAKAFVAELGNRIKAKENRIDRFKGYIINCLEATDAKEIEGAMHTVSLRKPTKVVNITNEDKIPAKFTTVKTTVTVSKKDIAKALKAGEKVEGACLVDGNKSLTIKLGGK